MKLKLILALLIVTSSLSYSQSGNDSNIDRTIFQEYYLVNKSHDTILAYGKIAPASSLHDGFEVYDENGDITDVTVNPDYWEYLFYKNYDGKIVRLKSLPLKKRISDYQYKNVFMMSHLENSDEEVNSGKINFYSSEFNTRSNAEVTFASGTNLDIHPQTFRTTHIYTILKI